MKDTPHLAPASFAGQARPTMPVLLYDGECGLCNNAVRLLLRLDRHRRLHYAALQSPPAQDYLRSHALPTKDFDSMIFVPDWSRPQDVPPKFRTDAGLAAIKVVGGIWRAALILRVVPRPLRDAIYRVIGHWRYRLFGPYRPRPLARPGWYEQFLPGAQPRS